MIGAQGGATLRQIDELFGAGTVAGLSDAQLLERFLTRRDASAFEALVARHGPMVLAVCRGVLRDEHATEDAFQATFLILVRKAGTIRGRVALGGWLYRVAHRVAVEANACARRRYEQERQAGIMRDASRSYDRRDDDRAAIHEEVARLPERQRLPVVLCYLGGRTHAEAAAELRGGEATVRRRLANARERLRSRLSRRGVAPAIVLRVASSSWRETVAIPSAWAATTTTAALRVTAGQAVTAGVVPASVAALCLARCEQAL